MDINLKRPVTTITMRHEEKFICSEAQLLLIESRIKGLLSTDANQKGSSYTIRSIYFDTYQDRLLKEGLSGLQKRDKFRIRTYHTQDSVIRLEKKTSIGQLKQKVSCMLTQEDVLNILDNPSRPYEFAPQKAPLPEFACLQKAEGLIGKVIVEYDRAAYVGINGNVRVTFDRNISATKDVQSFFDPEMITHPILPPNLGILEVKYDGILPGYLARALALNTLQRVSFSKYALCRNIIENNGRIEEYYEF